MTTTSHSIFVSASKTLMYEILSDPATHASSWQPHVEQVTGEKGLPVGSRGQIAVRYMGIRTILMYEVISNDGAGHILVRSSNGPAIMDTMIDVDETKRGTKVTVRVEISAGAPYQLAEPALAGVVEHVVKNGLRKLRVMVA